MFTDDDQNVLTAGMDGTIRLWEAHTGKPLRLLSHEGWVAGLAVSPDENWIASCGLDDTVRLWNAKTGAERYRLPGHGRTGGNGSVEVVFTPDGSSFLSFGGDMSLRKYSVRSGRITAEHSLRPTGAEANVDEDGLPRVDHDLFGAVGGGKFVLEQAEFTPDTRTLILGGRMGGALHFFDVETGKELSVFRPNEPLQDFFVAPEGKLLVTLEESAGGGAPPNQPKRKPPVLRIRDIATKKVLREIQLTDRYAYQAAFSPDGKFIALTLSENKLIRQPKRWIGILDSETLQEVARLDSMPEATRSMRFSRNGERLATSHEGSTVLLWGLTRDL